MIDSVPTPTLPSDTAPGAAPRQSLHFANRNPANSMKTSGQKKINRYTLPQINDCFPLRPQRLPRRFPAGLCGGLSASNRNNLRLEIPATPSKQRTKHFLIDTETAFLDSVTGKTG
jgi:hypothetical protein